MSEYWKSTPKKFCDFCKCWIADNKPSIDFHEKGKNHQANVKRKLAEIKKSTAKKRKQEETFKDDLAAIEAAALKAVQQDFEADPSIVGHSDVRAVVHASNSNVQRESNENQTTAPGSVWMACHAPTGHTYYYNSITGVSTWEMPAELAREQESSALGIPEEEHAGSQSSSNMKKSRTEEKETPKDCHPLLGGWVSVPSYERTSASNAMENPEAEEEVTAACPDVGKLPVEPQENQQGSAVLSKSSGPRFKEKTLKVPLVAETDAPVAFKKRKGAQGRSIRKREDDD